MRTLAKEMSLLTSPSPTQVTSPRTSSSQRLSSSSISSLWPSNGSPRTCLSSGLSSSSMSQDRTGQPVVNSDKSHDRTGQLVEEGHEIQRQNSESEQIRTLLDRQTEQILADCEAKVRKHELQADYDRSRTQNWVKQLSRSKKNFIVLKQKSYIDKIINFFMNSNWSKTGIFVKLIKTVSKKWKNWRSFRVEPSTLLWEED